MKSILNKIQKNFYPISEYFPQRKVKPTKTIEIISAWAGLELIIEDIINRSGIDNKKCIEFGVEFGYSSVVLSNYFETVVGVDTFEGDVHTLHKGDHYEKTKKALSRFDNIRLVKSTYQEWIKNDEQYYDLAHVDIIHTYEDTYNCGLWAVEHSKCTIFHDTESFIEVRKAVIDIAKSTGKNLFNYPFHNGLGIIF